MFSDSEWARTKGWLEPMVTASGLYDMAHIERNLRSGDMDFWSTPHSVAITEFLQFPLAKVLNVFAVAGEKGRALVELTRGLEPLMVAWGRANGCSKIMGHGIKSEWRPVCEAMGYSHQYTVMAKDI